MNESKNKHAVALGRIGGGVGGKSKSRAKQRAARKNGRLGGRPADARKANAANKVSALVCQSSSKM